MVSAKAFHVLFCSLLVCAFAFAGEAHNRLQADHKAKAEFRELNFFADGGGMHLVPGLIDVYEELPQTIKKNFLEETFKRRWGMVVVDGKPQGLFDVPYKGMHIGVLGCVACHSSKAAGIYIPGLGNKNIDVAAIGADARLIEHLYSKIPGHRMDTDYEAVKKSALRFADLLSNERLANLTQGMVPVSFIRTWFYRQAGQEVPQNITRGAVKVPALWGYGEKRKVGQFSDGFGNGNLPGWAVAVELTAGQEADVVRSYIPKIEHAENLFSDFLPPRYPFSIDSEKAKRGQVLFSRTCQGCHGSYERDADRFPVFQAPKFIPLEKVGTDDDRLNSNTAEFYDLVSKNPLSEILQANHFPSGYFAPRLNGIWARFPYWHNAAIPNIKVLLTPPEKRPEAFSLRDAGEAWRFDQKALGLALAPEGSQEEKKLIRAGQNGDREVYWVGWIGHSNQGHPFGTKLSDQEKQDLIEYLKTL